MGIEQFIIKEVTNLIMPLLEEKGIELVDLQYRHENTGWVLRLFIDKPEGISVNHCAEVSRELGSYLDARELIPHNYHLEVSSPGVNRPLKKIDDFKKFTGHTVKITTTVPIDNRKNFAGVLKIVNLDTIVIEINGRELNIPFHLINKANLKEM